MLKGTPRGPRAYRRQRSAGRGDGRLRIWGLAAIAVVLAAAALRGHGPGSDDSGAWFPWLGRDVLLEHRTRAATDSLSFAGGDPHDEDWIEERGRIAVELPREMSVAEFLSLYHLENRRGVREALAEEGLEELDDVIEAGREIRLDLNEYVESW